jgi:hypothetical protein
MRHPPDDAAEQPATRRPSQHSGPGPAAGQSSVFLPGYESGRPSAPESRAAGQGGDGPAPWYGSAAGGAAGKGPVRGFPPQPGQPPPMYPPGQFAAWNRDHPANARPGAPASPASQPGPAWQAGAPPPDGSRIAAGSYYGRDSESEADPGYSRLAISDPAADVTSTQTWQAVGDGRATGTWTAPYRPGPGAAGPPAAAPAVTSPSGAGTGQLRGRSGPAGSGLSGVGQEDAARAGGPADRGSRLAPWSPQAAASRAALAEPQAPAGMPPAGRTGEHAVPAGTAPDPDGAPGRIGRRGARDGSARPRSGRDASGQRGRGRRGRRGGKPELSGAAGPGRAETPTGGAPAAGTRPAGIASAGSRPPAPGRLAVAGASGAGASGATDALPGRARSRPAARGKHHGSLKLAVAGVIVLVLAAASALYLFARATTPRPHGAASTGATKPTTSASPSPSPSASPTSPYGHIASRSGDPQPLTIAQLYPASFSAGGASFARASSRLSKNCTAALTGSGIQGAVSAAGCSQAARATYVSVKDGMMGTIGVLNLRTAQTASKAARHAGATDFISQLPGPKGPTHKIGQGTGIEEAAAKGHYLILMWAELTSLHRPRTTAQRSGLERFMTELLQNTVNVTLTDRMVNGTPS